MSVKTLYISDLDGTLLNKEKEISGYSQDILNRLIDGGVHFSVATARTSASSVKILSGIRLREPVVLMNGVVIYDISREHYLKTEEISARTVEGILAAFKRHELTGFMYAVSDNRLVTFYENLCTPALTDFYEERVTRFNKPFEQVESFVHRTRDNRIIYFVLIDEFPKLSRVAEELRQYPDIGPVLYKDIYAENQWYLEVFSKNASKYHAVQYLRELGGYDRVIGFGDNLNDIPLFEACDECYAVSNAVEELKRVSTGVIGANHEDGVARFIAQREGLGGV